MGDLTDECDVNAHVEFHMFESAHYNVGAWTLGNAWKSNWTVANFLALNSKILAVFFFQMLDVLVNSGGWGADDWSTVRNRRIDGGWPRLIEVIRSLRYLGSQLKNGSRRSNLVMPCGEIEMEHGEKKRKGSHGFELGEHSKDKHWGGSQI